MVFRVLMIGRGSFSWVVLIRGVFMGIKSFGGLVEGGRVLRRFRIRG